MSESDNRSVNAYGVAPAPGNYGAAPHAPAWDKVIDEQRGLRRGSALPNPSTTPPAEPPIMQESLPDEDESLSFGPIARMLYGEKPRRVLAVSEDAHGILFVLNNPNSKNRIEDVAYFPYPATLVLNPRDRIDWIAEAVKEFTPDWARVDLWVQAPSERTHCHVLELPDLKGAELDAVALLQANKQQPIHPDTMRFDYRTTGPWDASRPTPLRPWALRATRNLSSNSKTTSVDAGFVSRALPRTPFPCAVTRTRSCFLRPGKPTSFSLFRRMRVFSPFFTKSTSCCNAISVAAFCR